MIPLARDYETRSRVENPPGFISHSQPFPDMEEKVAEFEKWIKDQEQR